LPSFISLDCKDIEQVFPSSTGLLNGIELGKWWYRYL
jgi:hypothetical protein